MEGEPIDAPRETTVADSVPLPPPDAGADLDTALNERESTCLEVTKELRRRREDIHRKQQQAAANIDLRRMHIP